MTTRSPRHTRTIRTGTAEVSLSEDVCSCSLRCWLVRPGLAAARGHPAGKDQADRAISKAQLQALPPVHMPPIDVMVCHGSQGSSGLEVGFPLRCFQRLSRPYLATRPCHWRDNRCTRGMSIPVLSY